ncbi:putative serine/threonine-protein kinase [Apostasia shenzhenica]|uniref:Putative serine/threonine-protein kinase n=1 Tax=Apostasia shenzhenica TaxID=1088818 RepID=A0A2I0BDU1_9ASPA|nr:putative serine/threonine-protein kinase [Apostasia shenzhenica]
MPPMLPPILLLFPFYLTAAVLLSPISPSPSPAPLVHHSCSTPPAKDLRPCPPFSSPPSSFPFSTSPGCGHPSFQIRCASSFSVISISSVPFRLLSLHPDYSLTLSPFLPVSSFSSSCPSLPSSPLVFSPFRLSAATCRNLSSLLPCDHSSSNIPSCSLSPFHRRLAGDPLSLFPACPRSPAAASYHQIPCTPDIPAAISSFLDHGVLVEWDSRSDPYFANCTACRRSAGGICGFNDSSPSKPFLCFPSTSHHPHHRHRHRILLAAAVVVISTGILISAIAAITAFCRRRRESSVSDLLDRHQIQQAPVFTFEQLRSWTNGFDPRRKIGDGGFGAVYLAQLDDGRIAAVKRLYQRPASTRSFCNEIKILSSLRHPNLVRFHGYCCDPRGLLLVYDYVPNGTLADHLHGSRRLYRKAALTWPIRLDIALQTAAALEYLHFSLKPPVVHRDITSCNIFVERDMRIKVGDFGLSRLLAATSGCGVGSSGGGGGAAGREWGEEGCCTGPQGTPGYLDPEYHRTFRLTEKSDVYSFGVVMMELVTGMKAVDVRRDKREISLAEMMVGRIQVGQLRGIVDPLLLLLRPPEDDKYMTSIETVAELAFRCVAGDKDDRPDAREIVEQLKRIRSRIQEAPPPPPLPSADGAAAAAADASS